MPIFSKRGFTLIEVIVTLMLVGILASAAGLGLVEVVRGYQQARENARTAQTARIALMRMGRELADLESLSVAGPETLVFNTPDGVRSFGLVGTDLLFDDNATAADGQLLANQVTRFDLGYETMDGQPWTTAMPSDRLGLIRIELALGRIDDGLTASFTLAISPRNNRTANAPG